MFLAAKGHQWIWWIVGILQFIAALGAVAPAYILGDLAARLQAGSLTLILALSGIALYFACALLQEICFAGTVYFDDVRRALTAQNARMILLDNTLGQSFDFFTRNLSGQVAGRINQIGESVNNIAWGLIGIIAIAGIRLVGVFAILMTIHWVLAVLFVLWLCLSYWRVILRILNVREANEAWSKAHSTTSGQIVDLITNFQSFFSGGILKHERKRIAEFIQTEVTAETKTAEGELGMLMTRTGWMAGLGVMLLGGSAYLVWQHQITIPQLYMLIGLWGTVSGVGWINWTIGQILWNHSKAEEQLSGLLEPYTVLEPEHPTAIPAGAPEIHYNQIDFTYPKADQIFSKLDIKIEPGQHVGLVGKSGAGKSTLVSLLLRHYDVNAGAVTISGVPLPQIARADLRAFASVVPQDPSLFHRSIFDNVRFARPEATLDEVKRACELAHASEFIETLPEAYNSLVGEHGIKLSVGQRQRVAIARALLKNAPLVIFDEATSALDSESEAAIQEAIATQFHGKTLLVVAHRLSTLRAMDRIIVLDHGKVVQDGAPNELLAEAGIFKHLWDLQSAGFIADITQPPFEAE